MQILWVEIAFCNESNQLMKFCTTNRNQGIHEFLPLLTKIMSKTYPGHSPFSMYHTFKQLKLLSTIIPRTFISFDTIIKYCNFNLFSLLIINTKSFRSWIDILWYKFILWCSQSVGTGIMASLFKHSQPRQCAGYYILESRLNNTR